MSHSKAIHPIPTPNVHALQTGSIKTAQSTSPSWALGINGHLGFTEPAEYLQPFAHVAELSQASLAHAMLAKSNVRPTYGLTLGMADLIQSRHILLLVSGSTKRDPLQRLLGGRISTEFPASMLQVHPNVLLICDRAAAG